MEPYALNNHDFSKQQQTYEALDVICLSHLRWDFVYQRPQHLMSRFGAQGRVFFVEEPIWDSGPVRNEVRLRENCVWVATPHLTAGMGSVATEAAQKELLDDLIAEYRIHAPVLWYYTPAALPFTRHLEPLAVVYDCMDELSLFKGASPKLSRQEAELFDWADLVFTGGPSLYAAKRSRHPSVHLFPSSIDTGHFGQARVLKEAADQATIPRPRLGFFGVIDERLDIELLRNVAGSRPQWHLVMIGPVAKIDPAQLPQADNIHYLGMRPYQQLPAYLSGWDVALLPFALNEATRFISPTKTPEYLAGGKPVVSTPVRDVLYLYGDQHLVHIAATVPEFVAAVESALDQGNSQEWLQRVDSLLATNSWDCTWGDMKQLLDTVISGDYLANDDNSIAGKRMRRHV